MSNLIPIDSLEDPRVQPFSLVRDRMQSGDLMVVDSEKVVCRAIACGAPLKAILATAKYHTRYSEQLAALGIPLYCAEHKLLETIVGHRIHQGMMALAERPEDTPLEFLGHRIVALNRVLDVQNVGSIVRSARAFGVDSVIVDREGCSPWGRRSVRVSMGAVFQMKIHHTDSLAADLYELHHRGGYEIVQAAKREGAVSLPEASFQKKSVLVIGNEHEGLTQEVQEVCQTTVEIPIDSAVDSLNAATAAAVLLYGWHLK